MDLYYIYIYISNLDYLNFRPAQTAIIYDKLTFDFCSFSGLSISGNCNGIFISPLSLDFNLIR